MKDKILSRILLLIQEDREDEEFFRTMEKAISYYEIIGNTIYIYFNNGKAACIEHRLDSYYCKFYSTSDILSQVLIEQLNYFNEDSEEKPMSKDRVKFYLLNLSNNYSNEGE